MLRASLAHSLKPQLLCTTGRNVNSLKANSARIPGGGLRRAGPSSQPYFKDSAYFNRKTCCEHLWRADLREGPIPLKSVRGGARPNAYTVPVPLRSIYAVRRYGDAYAETLGVRRFHSTVKLQGLPFYLLVGLLKKSTALEMARVAARIALTFVPFILIKNMKTRRFLERVAPLKPELEAKRPMMLASMRRSAKLMRVLLAAPLILFALTLLASLERTPITGRLRLILLSPEEEDEIAAQLAGSGWYQAVGQILSEDDGATPRLIPPSDWRYTWVQDTLRHLESAIPVLQAEAELQPDWSEVGPDDIPLPPPAKYPLRPRPRYMEMLSRMCYCQESSAPHGVPGPPYSLLLVDKAVSSNAFSYGFGPDGGGGIVVYSGFLDDVLSRVRPPSHQTPELESQRALVPSMPEEQSWWAFLFGGVFGPGAPAPRHPTPTPEQTSELAILLAHELSHLVLAHHLETLSSSTILGPGAWSLLSDFIRTLLFPVTMFFGPFVNDAVANMGKIGSGELSRIGHYCTSMEQEIEADIVSARILAHAGFDARDAVRFWEVKTEVNAVDQRQAASANSANASASLISPSSWSSSCGQMGERTAQSASTLAMRIFGGSHPVDEVRVNRLKKELDRWEKERATTRANARRDQPPSQQSLILQPPE